MRRGGKIGAYMPPHWPPVFEGLQAPYLLKSITSRNLHFLDTTSLPGLTLTGTLHWIETKFLYHQKSNSGWKRLYCPLH
ncbi:unnamed protein product [Lactuca virosa]|uniref:Uncharacterized protein n=1 Tax=Lactuca virosa TaxID=75947 RepID=A0AAU9P2E6_9ASTR|nr:unnamed protein product [Lactuca virosa]